MPLFEYTPNVVLGAIIVTAVIGLIDLPAARQIWKIDKFDFLVMLCAIFYVIFLSVQNGLAIAVGLSFFKLLMQVTRPKTVIMGNIPGTDIYRNLRHYSEAQRIPGFLILSIESPVNFANSNYLTERTSRWIEECEVEEAQEKHTSLRFLILEMSAVNGVDTNGVSFFRELKKTSAQKDIELVFANPLSEVIEKLQRADEAEEFMRPEFLFLTVAEAVASLSLKGPSLNNV